MPVTRTLKHSPSIAEVAQARSDFESAYGPADLIYRGQVQDPYDGMPYSFTRPLVVEQLYPTQGRFVLALLDGFLPWSVTPITPYSFDLIARDRRPARSLDLGAELPAWAARVRPYAAASTLADLGAMLKALGFRKPIAAPSEGSITTAFRAKGRRCGIYVLHFANGEYYVGQTVDMTRRFLQHRKRHSDISRVSFRPLGKRSLSEHEAQLIRLLERKQLRLRNIDMTSILATEPGAFDDLMDAPRQQRWLADSSYSELGGPRMQVTGHDAIYHERYAQLTRSVWYDDVLAVVRAYVYAAIPAIRSGEASYWQASVLPSGQKTLVRININWQEVFFVYPDQGLVFYLLASRRELQRAFGDDLGGLSRRYPDIELEAFNYRAGGSDQVSVWLWDTATALRFVTDPDVIPALRHYTLRLMKKGKCPWARSHNFDLVTDLLSEQAVAQAPVGA